MQQTPKFDEKSYLFDTTELEKPSFKNIHYHSYGLNYHFTSLPTSKLNNLRFLKINHGKKSATAAGTFKI